MPSNATRYFGPLPANEQERLRALDLCSFLYADDGEPFDCITALAKEYFKVPYALITVIEKNRQWFKSAQGMAAGETSRAASFCTHAILNDRVMVIPNAKLHPLFSRNEAVIGAPFVRFYAGAPIFLRDRYAIGTLCLVDTVPCYDFSPANTAVLAQMAKITAILIDRQSADQH